MQLVSNTIYKCVPFLSSPALPTLYIGAAGVKVYVSLNQKVPVTVAEMVDVTAETTLGFNVLQGQIRFVCVVYTGDIEVKDCGIVQYQDYTGL